MKVFFLGLALFISGMLSKAILLAGTLPSMLSDNVQGLSYQLVLDRKGLAEYPAMLDAVAIVGVVIMLGVIVFDVVVWIRKRK